MHPRTVITNKVQVIGNQQSGLLGSFLTMTKVGGCFVRPKACVKLPPSSPLTTFAQVGLPKEWLPPSFIKNELQDKFEMQLRSPIPWLNEQTEVRSLIVCFESILFVKRENYLHLRYCNLSSWHLKFYKDDEMHILLSLCDFLLSAKKCVRRYICPKCVLTISSGQQKSSSVMNLILWKF